MFKYLTAILITLFWIIMTALLWHLEFNPANDFSSELPADLVWKKILTAPDDSTLEILHQGKKIGYCHWRPAIGGEEEVNLLGREGFEPEGMVRDPTGYSIDLTGSILVRSWNMRFKVQMLNLFTTDASWIRSDLQILMPPLVWQIGSSQAGQTIEVSMHDATDPSATWQDVIQWDELRDPVGLLQRRGVELPIPLPHALPKASDGAAPLSLRWTARYDWLQIGRSKVRIYQLTAAITDQFQIRILVSRVGELLRIELPYQIVLQNEALLGI